MSKTNILNIYYSAFRKMLIVSDIMKEKYDEEILGYLVVDEGKNGFGLTVTDIIIPEQKTSSILCESDKDKPLTLTQIPKKLMPKIKGWFHSHKNMGLFYSTTDDETLEKWAYYANYAIGLVISLPNEVKGYIQHGKPFLTDKQEIEINIIYDNEDSLRKELERELEKKVTKKTKEETTTETKTTHPKVTTFINTAIGSKFIKIRGNWLNINCNHLMIRSTKDITFNYRSFYKVPKDSRGKIKFTFCQFYTHKLKNPILRCEDCLKAETQANGKGVFPYKKETQQPITGIKREYTKEDGTKKEYRSESFMNLPHTTYYQCEHLDLTDLTDVFCLHILEAPKCEGCEHNREETIEVKNVKELPEIPTPKTVKNVKTDTPTYDVKKGWILDAKKGWIHVSTLNTICAWLQVLDSKNVMRVFKSAEKDIVNGKIKEPSILCSYLGKYPECRKCPKESEYTKRNN